MIRMVDLQRIIDEYLLYEKEPKHRERDVYWVSEAVFPCIRSTYLKIKFDIHAPPDALRLYWIGTVLHDFMEKALRKRGVAVSSEEEMIVKLPGFSTHGRFDLKIKDTDGEKYIVEFKSCNIHPKKPLPHHVEQLYFYLNCEDIGQGFLVYVRKTSLAVKQFKIHRSITPFEKTLEHVLQLHKALEEDTIPPRNPFEWDSRICRFCTADKACKEAD